MASNIEPIDDQDSGWLEVKKKHRSSPKFSLQGWVGGFSGKHASKLMRSQRSSNGKGGNLHGKHKSDLSKAVPTSSLQSQGSVACISPLAKGDRKDAINHNEFLDTQEGDCSKSPLPGLVNVENAAIATQDSKKAFQNDKLDVVHKIKWGDLEDDALMLCCKNTIGTEITFSSSRANNVTICKKSEHAHDTDPSCTEFSKKPVASGDTELLPDQVLQSSCDDPLSNDVFKDVNEASKKDQKISVVSEVGERRIDRNGDSKDCKEVNLEDVNSVGDQPLSSSLSVEESGITVEGQVHNGLTTGNSETIEEPNTHRFASSVFFSKDVEFLEKCGPESPRDVDASKSKERFRQRLWYFLFENLNRAVDELYLLCELECDLEQMKEAILVLEEAASDFKELVGRVEGFENVKNSSDEVSITMKTDCRRPHALSWEVRRMTTSTHKAEILSSSLDAFKKMQQERGRMHQANNARTLVLEHVSGEILKSPVEEISGDPRAGSPVNSMNQSGASTPRKACANEEDPIHELGRCFKVKLVNDDRHSLQMPSRTDPGSSKLKNCTPGGIAEKSSREQLQLTHETAKMHLEKEKMSAESNSEKILKSMDNRRSIVPFRKDKEKKSTTSWKSMNAWKEKRNWGDILTSPFSHGMSRRRAERGRVLHDKLMSPDKKKKNSLDLKREAEEKHARATRIRSELENERVQKLQRSSEKLSRVNEWQAVRSMKLREEMFARHQHSASRHEAYLAEVVKRAGDESIKVNEVRFITSLTEENKKLMLRQKLQDSELRRAEKLQLMKSKQKEDIAREEAVMERKKLIEAEKLQRLVETQRRKEEAQVRREEERRASSAAREARAIENLRRKEIRAKAQQEEAELLAQRLAEKLTESEQRRKFYLEQIRERASMDFRDQSSPLLRRFLNKESQGRSTSSGNSEDHHVNSISVSRESTVTSGNVSLQHPTKRRIKKIRQRLMSLKYEFMEPPISTENGGIGYRTALGTARAKIGKWLQELKKFRQARKEGAASIGLVTAEMIKFLEGRDAELHASRQVGLIDFIASALPASHTSKPEACKVTIYFLRLLKVVLSTPANRSYFLAQNLLPPIIPMLSAALENYIKIAASMNVPGSINMHFGKTAAESFESFSEVLDGFLWTCATIIGHMCPDERQLQMQDGLLELVVAYQVIHRLRDFFALYDRPQLEGSPFPSSIILSINFLVVLTSTQRNSSPIDCENPPFKLVQGSEAQEVKLVEPVTGSMGDNRETLSVLNDCPVLDVPENVPLDDSCQTNSNDESRFAYKECCKKNDGTVVLNYRNADNTGETQIYADVAKSFASKGIKNPADCDGRNHEKILDMGQPLAYLLSVVSETGLVSLPSLLTAVLLQANNKFSSDQASYFLPSNFEEVATGVLKVLNNLAFIDIPFLQNMLARPDLKMEFFHLMSFLLSHCTSKWKVANDQVGFLLLESLLLLGHFALFHTDNQAVLRWGKSPTVLHKVCDLPFTFFSSPELMPVLAGTLVAACCGCEQNKGVVQQELSTDMILSLLHSCKNAFSAIPPNPTAENTSSECNNRLDPASGKHFDAHLKSSRINSRSIRGSSRKSNSSGNGGRSGKARNQRDGKARTSEELDATLPESARLMLCSRFSAVFMNRAEEFFARGSGNGR